MSLLQTERGITIIQDSVVANIVGVAVAEVDGLWEGSSGAQTASTFLGSLPGATGTSKRAQGVSCKVGQEEAAINLTLTVEYARSILQLAEAVHRNMLNRVKSLGVLRGTEVNITSDDA